MRHKLASYECSKKLKHRPSVPSLLPVPLHMRGVQPVGQLDEDTTGLLLLADDGTLICRLTSPSHHVPKVYDVGTKRRVNETLLQRLRDSVVQGDDPAPVRADGRSGASAVALAGGQQGVLSRSAERRGLRAPSPHTQGPRSPS